MFVLYYPLFLGLEGRFSTAIPAVNFWLRLLWLQCLCDHDLLLEVLHHVCVESNFGGLLCDRHGVDFVLELEQRVEKIFRAWRTTGDIDVNWDDLVDTLQNSVGIERTAYQRASTHGDHPLGVGHLIVDSL